MNGSNNVPQLSTFEQVRINDRILTELATYDVTHGYTNMKPMSDLGTFHQTIMNRFVEFKRLVKSGEFSMDELTNDVCVKYGICK